MKLLAPAAVLLMILAFGCNKQPDPIPNEKPADPPATATAAASSASRPNPHAGMGGGMGGGGMGGGGMAPATPAADDLTYTAPAAWTSAPNPSPMRKATFKIPKQGGEPDDAELAVSAAMGGVDQNVKRWEGQFGDAKAKKDARLVNGLKVTVVEIKGTYASGGMMGTPSAPKDNQMLLGAIVDQGDRQTFFKMTGGEKTVTAAKKDFDAFVSSFHAK